MSMKSTEIPPKTREEVWFSVPRLRFCGNLHLNIFSQCSWKNFLFGLKAECCIKLLFPPLMLSVKELLMYLGNLSPHLQISKTVLQKNWWSQILGSLMYMQFHSLCGWHSKKNALALCCIFMLGHRVRYHMIFYFAFPCPLPVVCSLK